MRLKSLDPEAPPSIHITCNVERERGWGNGKSEKNVSFVYWSCVCGVNRTCCFFLLSLFSRKWKCGGKGWRKEETVLSSVVGKSILLAFCVVNLSSKRGRGRVRVRAESVMNSIVSCFFRLSVSITGEWMSSKGRNNYNSCCCHFGTCHCQPWRKNNYVFLTYILQKKLQKVIMCLFTYKTHTYIRYEKIKDINERYDRNWTERDPFHNRVLTYVTLWSIRTARFRR